MVFFKKILSRAAIALISVLIMLLLIEGVLALSGADILYQHDLDVPINPERDCDAERGCWWVHDVVTAGCDDFMRQTTKFYGRHCHINEQGFYDDVNYDDAPPPSDYSILVMGDSFTVGYTADIGKSWAEVAEQRLTGLDVNVWNVALSGSGTEQAILNMQRYAPRLKPDLLLLAFNNNDLDDNLFPPDAWRLLDNGEGGSTWVRQYRLDENLDVAQVSDVDLYYRSQGFDSTQSGNFERTLLNTRIGSAVLPALTNLQTPGAALTYFDRPPGWLDVGFARTEALLADFKATADALDIPVMVLLIPNKHFSSWAAETQSRLDALFAKYDMPVVHVVDLMESSDYINENPDDSHWNNAGHGKAGLRMGRCLREIITTETFPCSQAGAAS